MGKLCIICLALTCLSAFGQAIDNKPQMHQDDDGQREKLKPCSTEKINGNCFVNIDRRFPIVMPTFPMRPSAYVSVNVYNPLDFETLTLDPGTAQALQSTDQAAGLVTAAAPLSKGIISTSLSTERLSLAHTDDIQLEGFVGIVRQGTVPSPVERQRATVASDLLQLDSQIKQTFAPIQSFLGDSELFYAQIREIQSPIPRPQGPLTASPKRTPGVYSWTYIPWDDYNQWRNLLLYELFGRTVYLDGDVRKTFVPPVPLPKDPAIPNNISAKALALQDRIVPKPDPNHPGQMLPLDNPLFDQSKFDVLLAKTKDDINARKVDGSYILPAKERSDFEGQLAQMTDAEPEVVAAVARYASILPKAITSITGDFQTVGSNITFWTGDATQTGINGGNPILVGRIPDPASPGILAPYKALGRQITYTLNAVNQVATSTLSIPTAQQKQAVVTITVLYANPRFEASAGAFVSWLPNRTFANFTDVGVLPGKTTPTTLDIKIGVTTANPEVLPYAAANWRIGPEFVLLGQRRSAIYGTVAAALNPYNTLPEVAGGFSLSWRALMFSPLYHLGHSTHLTQGEVVGQIWCQNSPVSTDPPPCSSNPPAPTTKTYWTGTFAFGIGVRIPTTFSAGK